MAVSVEVFSADSNEQQGSVHYNETQFDSGTTTNSPDGLGMVLHPQEENALASYPNCTLTLEEIQQSLETALPHPPPAAESSEIEVLRQKIAGLHQQVAILEKKSEEALAEHEEQTRQLKTEQETRIVQLQAEHEAQIVQLQAEHDPTGILTTCKVVCSTPETTCYNPSVSLGAEPEISIIYGHEVLEVYIGPTHTEEEEELTPFFSVRIPPSHPGEGSPSQSCSASPSPPCEGSPSHPSGDALSPSNEVTFPNQGN